MVPTVPILLMMLVTAECGEELWWLDKKDIFGTPSSSGYTGYSQPQTQVQKRPSGNQNTQLAVQPPFQQQQTAAVGSCPVIGNNLPPVEVCADRSSNCWSVGQPDVDCVDHALCCFDGCANTCYYANGQPAAAAVPQQPVSPLPVISTFTSTQHQQSRPQKRPANRYPQQKQPTPTRTRPKPKPVVTTSIQQQQKQQQTTVTGSCPSIGNNLPYLQDCAGRSSNCWSVGRRDLDCVDNALCCFDGCANTCYYPGQPAASVPSRPAITTITNIRPQQQQHQQSRPQKRPSKGYPQRKRPTPTRTKQKPRPKVPTSIRQQQKQQQTTVIGSCPSIGNNLPYLQDCAGRSSNCWSVGQRDVDCVDHALCCFDGCANTCYYPGQATALVPALPVTGTTTNIQQQQQQQQQVNIQQRPSRKYPQRKTTTRRKQRPSTVVWRRQQQQGRPQPAADTKPFVMCPSAMLCVPKVNCDFKGVITDQTLNLTPQMETLRVPLIPCVNPDNRNIDVCCRDPNYVDPWPTMKQNRMRNRGGGAD